MTRNGNLLIVWVFLSKVGCVDPGIKGQVWKSRVEG